MDRRDLRRPARLFRRYAGLFIGALFGLVAGRGIFGLLLGGVVGYLIDELRTKRSEWRHIERFFDTADTEGTRPRMVWLASVATLASRVVTEGEEGNASRFALDMMRQRIAETFDLSKQEREILVYFSQFLPGAAETKQICRRFCEVSDKAEEREAVMIMLYRVAPVDSKAVTAQQDALIADISRELEIPPGRFNMIRETSVSTDLEAYRILGVPEHTESDEIKRVYHKLASQFHPDSGIELDVEQRQQTEEAFIRIQNAYQRIIAERSGQRRTDEAETDSAT